VSSICCLKRYVLLHEVVSLCHKLVVTHVTESTPSVVVDEAVKLVRQYIVCCIITGVSFVQNTFKKFIQLQVIQNISMD
jgi:hypothetical protein